MPIKVQILGADALEKIGLLAKGRREQLMQDLVKASSAFGYDAVAIAKKTYLSGPGPERLKAPTGRLRSSITTKTKREGNLIETSVGTNVVYAPIHEFGGTTMPSVTERMRKFAWAMFYKSNDEKWKRLALTRKSRLEIKIPKRPFIRPAIQDAMPDFKDNLFRIIKNLRLANA